MKTIVIDPGHGGWDNGAVANGRREKDDNLRLGLALRDKLRGMGYNVVMTRDNDTYVSLPERSNISNRNPTDLFISLHRNSFTNPAANGVENFTYYNPSSATQSYAQNVLNEVVSAGVQNNRGLKQANFSVLRQTTAPAQLLEMGFITNTADNSLFDSRFGAYVDAIARGVERSVGPAQTAPPPAASGDAAMRTIQQTLNNRYRAGLNADGIIGPATRRALIRGIQTELNNQFGAGLSADGIWGPRTRAAIRNIRSGDRGNIAYLIQAALYGKGYPISVDGAFGPATQNAVIAFQRANGLNADGVVGRDTFERLFAR